jgi:hypothetical protein
MSPLHRAIGRCLVFAFGLAGGCARYEYAIVEPPDLARHIGRKAPAVFRLDPVRYEARTYDNRLVLFIFNDADEPLKMLGEDGYAVDPRGESHPLRTRTIAPGSSTKLIFPPLRPTFRRAAPTFGFGVGVGLGSAARYGHFGRTGYGHLHDDPFGYDGFPRYYQLADDGTYFWNWTGDNTDVRVRFVYRLGDERFHHEFTFRRVKV